MATAASTSRAPRAEIVVAGATLALIECNVHSTSYQSADTFYASLPLDNDAGLNENFWLGTAPIAATIRATNNADLGGYTALLVGQVDEPQVDFARRVVSIKGRDLTAKLIALNTSEGFPNRTNLDVIKELAGRVGLTIQFSGDADKAGLTYDGLNFTEISDFDSAWNVIVTCAKRLGCVAFIKGTVLYVQPLDKKPTDLFTVTYQPPTPGQLESGSFVSLLAARNLELAKDVTIKLTSWQHRLGEIAHSEYGSKTGRKGSDAQLYQYRAANLNKEQQDRIARNHLRQTLSHERAVNIYSHPGDVSVSPLMGLHLTGTGTAADQDYVIGDITHRFSMREGYLMDIAAHSQDAEREALKQLK